MINVMLDKFEIKLEFVNGKCVIDKVIVEVVEMVFLGIVNKWIV